jgi:hypothetical protein
MPLAARPPREPPTCWSPPASWPPCRPRRRGLNDWSDTAGPEARVGLVHATVNTTALSLYLASLVARARGRRRGGKALGLAGLGVLTGGAYLGGHLSFG